MTSLSKRLRVGVTGDDYDRLCWLADLAGHAPAREAGLLLCLGIRLASKRWRSLLSDATAAAADYDPAAVNRGRVNQILEALADRPETAGPPEPPPGWTQTTYLDEQDKTFPPQL